MQSSCSSGTATAGIAAACTCENVFSSTAMQLTPTIASIVPVCTIAITSAEPSATSTA